MTVYIQHQRADKSFAVFIGGNDDLEGNYDKLYSYGVNDCNTGSGWITEPEARNEALAYARELADKFGGVIHRWPEIG